MEFRWCTIQNECQCKQSIKCICTSCGLCIKCLCEKDGSIDVQGEHDGFPCFEFYKQVDFGPFEKIYTHDFRETGDTAAALGGNMDYSFTKRL